METFWVLGFLDVAWCEIDDWWWLTCASLGNTRSMNVVVGGKYEILGFWFRDFVKQELIGFCVLHAR